MLATISIIIYVLKMTVKLYYYENETTIWDKYIHIIQKDVPSQILENSVTCDPQFQPCLTKVFDCLWYVAVVLYAVQFNHFSSFLVQRYISSCYCWCVLKWLLALCSAGLLNWGQWSVSHRHCWNSCWRHPHGLNTCRICFAFKICSIFTLFSHRSWCSRCCH